MANFNDSEPAAPLADTDFYLNGTWQHEGRDVSVYWPKRADLAYPGTLCGARAPSSTSTTYIPFATGTSQRDVAAPADGFIRNLIGITETAPTRGAMTSRVIRDGLDSGVAICIPPSCTVGDVWHDAVNYTTVLDGEPFHFNQSPQYTGTGTAVRFGMIGFEYAALDGSSLLIADVNAASAAGAGAYWSFGSAFTNATEDNVQIEIPFACTIDRMRVTTQGTQSGGDSIFTVRNEKADTSLAVTVVSGSVAGTYSNLTDSLTLAANAKINWHWANNGSSALTVRHVSFRLQPASGYKTFMISSFAPLATNTNDFVYRLTGVGTSLSGVAVEEYSLPSPIKGVLRNMHIRTIAGASGCTWKYYLVKNGVSTALQLTATVAISDQEWNSVTGVDVEVDVGDLLYVYAERVSGNGGGGRMVMEWESTTG